jgi:hypothetical protein
MTHRGLKGLLVMKDDQQEEVLRLEAQQIKIDFDACVKSSLSDSERVYKCRSLLSRLNAAFNGLQCGANDKISNPLHWEISDYLASIKNDKGESLAASME